MSPSETGLVGEGVSIQLSSNDIAKRVLVIQGLDLIQTRQMNSSAGIRVRPSTSAMHLSKSESTFRLRLHHHHTFPVLTNRH